MNNKEEGFINRMIEDTEFRRNITCNFMLYGSIAIGIIFALSAGCGIKKCIDRNKEETTEVLQDPQY